jgi:dolichol kinase
MISKLELRRQALHLTFGVILIALLYFNLIGVYSLVGILITGVTLSFLCKWFRIPIASWVMDNFEREDMRTTFPGKGPILFMLGSIIVISLFPKEIALAAMVMLAVGDAFSHIFGKMLSKQTYKYLKSVKGTLIGIGFSFVGALLFVDVTVALLGSVVTMSLEGIKLGLDDNLYIPVVAALVMSLL